MPGPATNEQFGDLLEPRFQDIKNDVLRQLPDMVFEVFSDGGTNGRSDMRFSDVGAFGDIPRFTGTVTYDTVAQGYDTTLTPLEFASGFQVERKLFDDDQYGIMDARPSGLVRAYVRTRQSHAFRPFNNAFSVDTLFYNNSEGVALCSNSHTTTAAGVSTATGFDNLTTAALSATAVTAMKIQGRGLRDDRGNRIETVWDELWYPSDLEDVAYEIINSAGKPTDATNAANYHYGKYTGKTSVYMSDTNNYFLADSMLRKESLVWSDRIGMEFAMVEDFDTLVAKWRLYGRWGNAHKGWRWIVGAQVS